VKSQATVAHDGMIDRLDFGLGYLGGACSVETVFFISFVCRFLLCYWFSCFISGGRGVWRQGRAQHSTAQRVVPLLHLVGVFSSVVAI
jgi:hypothetical protein